MAGRFFLATLIVMQPFLASAATRTASQDGPWASSSTWGGSAAPGNGDTAVLGDYVVTIANGTTVTVGTSPAPGTNAITIDDGGKLIIDDDATLNVRGDVTVTGVSETYTEAIVLEEGATLRFDGSAASSPSTAEYAMKLGTGYYSFPAIVANGTEANPCTITSHASGANGYITWNDFYGGSINLTHCDVSRIGSASTKGVNLRPARSTAVVRLRHVTADNCGRWEFIDADEAATIDLYDVKVTNSLDADESMRLGSQEAKTGGLRSVANASFDKTVAIYPPLDFEFDHIVYRKSFATTNEGWDKCEFILNVQTGVTLFQGDASNVFCYYANAGNDNPHFAQWSEGRSITFRRFLFQHSGSGIDGDCVQPASPSSPYEYGLYDSVSLPNAAGNTSGTMFSLLGNANCTIHAEHNTYKVTGANQSAAIAETYTGHAGMLASFESNLAWSDTAGEAEILHDSGTDNAVNDYVTDLGFNGSWNGAATLYALDVANDVANDLTANDVSGDPGFRDATRDLGAWGATQGGDGSEADAIDILADNPLLIDEMIAWVHAGVDFTNPAYHNTGHDGGNIGAGELFEDEGGGGGFINPIGGGPTQ